MRRRLIGVVAVVLFAVVAGCTPDGVETPSTVPVVTTPTVTPSPQWSADEQGAIDAVQRYLEVWTYIGQNLGSVDINQIRGVSDDPESNNDLLMWANWINQGWHLVGSPVFTPQSVIPGSTDFQGQRFDIYGCFVITDSYISDPEGNSVGDEGRQERGVSRYRVLHTTSDEYYVTESSTENKTC